MAILPGPPAGPVRCADHALSRPYALPFGQSGPAAHAIIALGEVAERLKATVSKTVSRFVETWVRIPPSPPWQPPLAEADTPFSEEVLERPNRHAWKACRGYRLSRVRIPPSPPSTPVPGHPTQSLAVPFSA